MKTFATLLLAALLAAFFALRFHEEKFLPLLGLGAAGAGGAVGVMLKSGAKWSSGARDVSKVSFYKDKNFQGPRRDFGLGTVQNSLSKGYLRSGVNKENDTYSSAIVPDGMEVVVYADNDLRGRSYVLKAGQHPDLGAYQFDDIISSFKIVSAGAGGGQPVVSFYEHENYKGKALNVFGDTQLPDLSAIPNIDSRNDIISSVYITPGWKVHMFENPNFSGKYGWLTASATSLKAQGFNDNISSIKVERA